MALAAENEWHASDEQQRLMLSMIEELKLPLLHAQQQVAVEEQSAGVHFAALREHLARGLWLIDAFALHAQSRQQVELVPVSISSVLYDASQYLNSYAKQYGCSLELSIEGRYVPVMADRRVLETAFVGVALSLIQATQASGHQLTLAAHKQGDAIVAGVFSNQIRLTDKLLTQGRALFGKARQPLQQVTAQPAAGLFIADALLETIQGSLRASQHHNQRGVAVALIPSQQLALV